VFAKLINARATETRTTTATCARQKANINAGLKKLYTYKYRDPIARGLCNQGVFCAMSAKSVYVSTMSLTPLFYLFKKKITQPNEALVSFLFFSTVLFVRIAVCLAALFISFKHIFPHITFRLGLCRGSP